MPARMRPDANGHDPETSFKKREVSGIARNASLAIPGSIRTTALAEKATRAGSPPPPCRSCARRSTFARARP